MANIPKAPKFKPKMPKAGSKPKVSRKGGLKETSPVTPNLTGAPANGMGPGVLSAATAALAGAPGGAAGAQPGTVSPASQLVKAKPFKVGFKKGKMNY